jgi:hypothetical protein
MCVCVGIIKNFPANTTATQKKTLDICANHIMTQIEQNADFMLQNHYDAVNQET